jgi:hypothetical protein
MQSGSRAVGQWSSVGAKIIDTGAGISSTIDSLHCESALYRTSGISFGKAQHSLLGPADVSAAEGRKLRKGSSKKPAFEVPGLVPSLECLETTVLGARDVKIK